MKDWPRLDRQIQFLRAEKRDDGIQVKFGSFEHLGYTVPARFSPVSDGERFRAAAIGSDVTARFIVPYSDFTVQITSDDRLSFEGKVFAITGIKEVGIRKRFEITTKLLQNVV